MVAKSDRSSLMFYKIPGMRSNATHTKDISGIPAENCMAFCLDDERCRAFTAIRGSAASPSRCLFYDNHVCNMKTTLLPHQSADYFDTNVDGKCPKSEG